MTGNKWTIRSVSLCCCCLRRMVAKFGHSCWILRSVQSFEIQWNSTGPQTTGSCLLRWGELGHDLQRILAAPNGTGRLLRTALVYHLQRKMSWATLQRKLFSTGSEQASKLRNYGPQKMLADPDCARLCVSVCTCTHTHTHAASLWVCMHTNTCCASRCICTDRSTKHMNKLLSLFINLTHIHI